MQRIRTAFFTLALTAVAIPCLAQTGTVTFYSIGLSAKQQVKVAVVPVGTVPFTGWLFDGNQRMRMLIVKAL